MSNRGGMLAKRRLMMKAQTSGEEIVLLQTLRDWCGGTISEYLKKAGVATRTDAETGRCYVTREEAKRVMAHVLALRGSGEYRKVQRAMESAPRADTSADLPTTPSTPTLDAFHEPSFATASPSADTTPSY